ncbi:MAG: phosphatase PAP2 family protein [Ignavibacteriales bacterium]|nr:MAG: phosphatase PAP2 family protein [Ignavibacteriales bacterium]
MLKISYVIIFLNSFSYFSFAQSNLEKTTGSLGRAAYESMSWLDIPGTAYWVTSGLFSLKLKSKIDVDPFTIDRDIHNNISVPGHHSLGSTDPRRYPETVFLTRLAVTTGAGLFFGIDTYESYKHTLVFMKAVMYNFTLTEIFKDITHRTRPDNSDSRSFFSGHTSSAFVTSAFLFKETSSLLDENVKDDVLRTTLKTASFTALYGWAGYVGYSRIKDNKHYFSDVLFGAVAGTLIGIYVHDFYFNEDSGILKNISLGMQNSQPTLNFRFDFD